MPLFDIPFALSIGPQRAGTTWLDHYLRARGDVCMPSGVKEIFFFDRHYDRGADFYKSHFHPLPQHKLAMEISTTSFDCPEAPARAADTLGTDITLLCPLRNPIIRSYSLYLHLKRYGLVQGSLREASAANPMIINSSHYVTHIRNWLRHFPRENLHIYFQERGHDPYNYVASICQALDLPFQAPHPGLFRPINSTASPPLPWLARAAQIGADKLRARRLYPLINLAKAMGLKPLIFGKSKAMHNATDHHIPPDDYAYLESLLKPEIHKLETLLERDIPFWHP